MNMNKIHKVMTEMDNFNRAVIELKEKERQRNDYRLSVFNGCKETGALKRASMDLTRALADMRKPG